MSENWKPGDVALVTLTKADDASGLPSVTHIAMRDNTGSWASGTTLGRRIGNDKIHEARRLVVIDPEDREQVERLADLYGYDLSTAALIDALREFASPTPPKPEEPTAGGSQVREADGTIWTRVEGQPDKPWVYGQSDADYSALNVVEVLR